MQIPSTVRNISAALGVSGVLIAMPANAVALASAQPNLTPDSASAVAPSKGEWTDISSALQLSQGRPVFNRATRQYNVIVDVTNLSDQTLTGPFRLVIDKPSHMPVNAQWDSGRQIHYLPLSRARLHPGQQFQVAVPFALQRGALSFDPRLLQQQAANGWQLVWRDEFNGNQLDLTKWSYEQNCWGGGNAEQQCYTDRASNSHLQDGKLIITARREDFTGPDNPQGNPASTATLPYTSARLRSLNKGDWTYGRFEIKAKLPEGQGTWPAIWMLPSDYVYGSWAASGEIDIMEAVNLSAASDDPQAEGSAENRVYGTLHYGRQWPGNVHSGTAYRLPGNINPAEGFHEYAVEWEQDEIRWYVDDIHYATQTSDGWYSQYQDDSGQWQTGAADAPFNERFHLLLNLAVGGSWAANVNETGIDESAFPQRMAIDYVRVYECSVNPSNGQGCATVDANAQEVPGHTPPDISPQTKVRGPLYNLFDDELAAQLTFDTYNPDASLSYALQDHAGGTSLVVRQTGNTGNLYLHAAEAVDMSDYAQLGQLKFALRVLDNSAASGLLIKLDSGWPAVSDYDVSLPLDNEWHQVSVPVAQIIAGGNRYAPGNNADLNSIINTLVIEPSGPLEIELDNIRYEFDTTSLTRLSIFDDANSPPFVAGKYVASGQLDIEDVVAADSEHNIVRQFSFNTNEAVGYFQSAPDNNGTPIGFDARPFDTLAFDLLILEDLRTSGGFNIKVDCGHPCGSADFIIQPAPPGQWKSFTIPLQELVTQPGSTLNLSRVDTPLVIFPDWGNQQGVVLQVDNVHFTTSGLTPPTPANITITEPYTLYADALATYWTLWDCCGNARFSEVNTGNDNHGPVAELDYFGPAPTVAGFRASIEHNVNDYATANPDSVVKFDLFIAQLPLASAVPIMLKVEASDGSVAEFALTDSLEQQQPVPGEWQTYSFRLADLAAQGLTLSKLNLLLVFPQWGEAQGAILQVDNVLIQ